MTTGSSFTPPTPPCRPVAGEEVDAPAHDAPLAGAAGGAAGGGDRSAVPLGLSHVVVNSPQRTVVEQFSCDQLGSRAFENCGRRGRPVGSGAVRRRIRLLGRGVRLPRALVGLCWLVLVSLAALALARLAGGDGNELLAEVNSLNGLAYVPAWPVLLLAGLGRRPVLLLAALAVVAAQLAFALPEVLAGRALPAWAGSAGAVRLFDANVGSDIGNLDMSGFARQIERDRPGVVTLEEISPADFARLASNGGLAGLPYRSYVGGAAPWGFGIASRFPLRVGRALFDGPDPFLVPTRLRVGGTTVRLWMVHTDAPPTSVARWRSDLDRIAARVAAEGRSRLVVAGDFNASWGNAGFRAVLERGLVDGAAARGVPFQMTWPANRAVPPLVRIDHVLTGTGVAVRRIAAVDGPGSDHRALEATVAIRG